MADPKLKLGNDIWATKQKSLLAYNDEGGNFKSLPFQVDRISSGSYVGRNGLVQYAASNEPRIDFLNNTKGHLKLEPQRSNLITYSEDFSQWLLDGSQSSPTTITDTNPDGSSQVYQIELNAGGNIYRTISVSSSTDYTFSVYIKGSGFGRLILSNPQSVPENYVDFTATSEWQRIELTGSSSSTSIRVAIGSWSNSPANGNIQIYGAQLEQGNHPTSIIPTSSAAVTRVVDFTFIPSGLQNILNTSEGTLFVDVDVPRVSSTGSFERIVLSDQNASTDRIIFDNYAGNWRALMLSSAGNVNKTIVSVTANQRIKVAIAYSSTELRISYDGNAATTTTGSYTPSTTLESFKFSNKDGGSKWNGNIYNLKYFDSALSNAELVELTS